IRAELWASTYAFESAEGREVSFGTSAEGFGSLLGSHGPRHRWIETERRLVLGKGSLESKGLVVAFRLLEYLHGVRTNRVFRCPCRWDPKEEGGGEEQGDGGCPPPPFGPVLAGRVTLPHGGKQPRRPGVVHDKPILTWTLPPLSHPGPHHDVEPRHLWWRLL